LSRTYTVVRGDRLTWISQKYYGTQSRANDIVKANPQLTGRITSLENYPTIYAGDVLIIPDDPVLSKIAQETITNNDNSISILIDNKLFKFFISYHINFEIDTFDTFTFSAPFDDSQEIYRESFRPFAYKQVSIYYGKDLIFTGVLLAPESSANADKKELTISGYSKPGILNDCMMPISSFPIELNNQNLYNIASLLCPTYGIQFEFQSAIGNPFEQVALEIDKNTFSFLSDLAKKRELLISNDQYGKLIFWKSKTGSPVASFKEGEVPFISCKPSFNYQSFYSHITGVTSTTDAKSSAKYTYENKYLTKRGILRNYNCTIADIKDSEIKKAVIAQAGRMFGESASYELTVQGHRDKNGNLYKKNTLITLLSPGAMVYTESKFLIKSLSMTRGVDGDTSTMSLVLPGAYTGEIPEIFPWEG
jgi:prophage tail gpP-like protein